jgi:AcrR family transcriptional regulator
VGETTEGGPMAGRRRDPLIETKVTSAAITVYARKGLNGFTFDAVARAAGVGKPALYRRWSSREDLLIQALVTIGFPTPRDLGSLRADFVDYAKQWVQWYRDQDRGLACARLWPDCAASPELSQVYFKIIVEPQVKAARQITRRAIDHGEIGTGLHSATIVELLIGAIGNHWMFTPAAKLSKLDRTFQAYAEHLVDIILAGVTAVAPPADARPTAVADAPKRASRTASATRPGLTRIPAKRASRKVSPAQR